MLPSGDGMANQHGGGQLTREAWDMATTALWAGQSPKRRGDIC